MAQNTAPRWHDDGITLGFDNVLYGNTGDYGVIVGHGHVLAHGNATIQNNYIPRVKFNHPTVIDCGGEASIVLHNNGITIGNKDTDVCIPSWESYREKIKQQEAEIATLKGDLMELKAKLEMALFWMGPIDGNKNKMIS